MREFQPFEMERVLSKWENRVQFNLSESGVHPATLRDLVPDPAALDELLATELGYAQGNGIEELRDRIAALYPGATSGQVLVTVGCVEANLICLQTLLRPGDQVAVMMPNYLQVWGAAANLGAAVTTFALSPEVGWGLDLDSLRRAVSGRTRLIAVSNPNNPTGHVLTEAEMAAVVAAAEQVGAWLLADEVYGGAERTTDVQTPSFWGRYDKLLATNSLSKAYGLPGLRIGWVAGPPGTIDEIWARHEYTTISAATLSHRLAAVALSPELRPKLIQRARDHIRRGYPVLEKWVSAHGQMVSVVPPQAGAIAFVRYARDTNSTDLVDRLIREKSVLVASGDCFGVGRHVRVSCGVRPEYLRAGLDRIHDLLAEG